MTVTHRPVTAEEQLLTSDDGVRRELVEGEVRAVVVIEPWTKTATVRSSRTEIRVLAEGEVLDVGDVVPGWKILIVDVFG